MAKLAGNGISITAAIFSAADVTTGGIALCAQVFSRLSAWGIMKNAKNEAIQGINKTRDQVEKDLKRLEEAEEKLKQLVELTTSKGFRFTSKIARSAHTA